ncbi:magnesium-translocating P-type ATPase [Mucilaginibacter sp. PPCGB 2223]|uniref:magnesium-translocating P-type ATPase n=1 Tax=Mucilaginibacter sp. PPCGB 2223 TaxID=1886027 RepID=UPI000826E668|nr:magnesium-translocating P-type ATPase [Mucilaginibacter sp. PPCGB 2223]OCX53912.1 magnesium-translocating P-type ATPase [Mucilaginibacter sp. PPCGB 2223]
MLNEFKPTQRFWNAPVDDAFHYLSSGAAGLTSAEAALRLKRYGANSLTGKKMASGLFLFISQFKSPITLLLIIASLLSAGLGDITDAAIIIAIVLISSLLGFWQEYHAAKAVAELLKMVQLHCSVLRDGQVKALSVEQVVPGDMISLSAGDIIPADCLLVESQELFTDEAVFTGETFPVEKNAGIVTTEAPLSKRTNTVFMGSHVISGKAKALAIHTGVNTELGKISADLKRAIPETDFEKGIRKFGYLLMEITLVLVIIIFSINVLLHKPVLNSLLFSLALAVGLTPQLLPAIISVNLSTGARRMAALKVIVKRLSSIENLGSMNILCSDKTGTITEGKIDLKDTTGIAGNHSDKVFQYAWLNASLQTGYRNPIDDAICSGYQRRLVNCRVLAEVPYDFVRKRLSVLVQDEQGRIAITKGALRNVLSVCDRAETENGNIVDIKSYESQITTRYEAFSNNGLRTIGLAYKPITAASNFTRSDETGMIFLGFITLFDPPKPNIAETIAKLNQLGVKLKIITGDNALVAKSLAIQIGFDEPQILTGGQINKMSNAALLHTAPGIHVFAEVEPNQKERIISILKRAGNVVGFMGDGINDAPALHIAEVGISVDTAVDIAKEAADIVLLSKDLEVLVDGIVEGRKTFTNTMKYIFMATSANFGNMFSMAGASLFLPFLPLLPKQILLTNLLTDLPEMAIAADRVDAINIQSPQRWDLHFIKRFMMIFGLLSSVFDYLTFGVLLLILRVDEKEFQTGWFIESVFSATLIVLIVRTRMPFYKSLPGKYLLISTIGVLIIVTLLPFLPVSAWFGFAVLPPMYYLWMGAVIAAYMLSAEMAKQWFYHRLRPHRLADPK